MRLSIGTAQFGQKYGVANIHGKVSKSTINQILNTSKDAGIDTLDTAILYGSSEKCLGEVGVDGWSIVTKLPEVDVHSLDIYEWIYSQFVDSLDRLKVDHITGLMLHRPMQLLEDHGLEIWDALKKIKSSGQVDKIGFSIYNPVELNQLWDNFKPDIVQVPFNILDQRIKKTGWLNKLDKHNIEVHVRSVFLQGLLLMERDKMPIKFHRWENIWEKLDKWSNEKKITLLEGALGYVLNHLSIDRVIIGIDTLEQLEEILNAYKNISNIKFGNELSQFSVDDINLINPSNWRNI